MKSLLRLLILVAGLAACSSGHAERQEAEQFRQVLLHLSWENKRILGRTHPAICGFALEQDHSSKHETPRWEDDPTFREYVDEAKRRGFSAQLCAENPRRLASSTYSRNVGSFSQRGVSCLLE
jgi:hypothetical protein